MEDDTDEVSAINISHGNVRIVSTEDKIELEAVSYDGRKKSKLEVKAGIYEATSLVEGDRTDHRTRVVSTHIEGFQCFLTLHALQERLKDPDLRRHDSDALKKDDKACPFELWYPTGSKANVPTTLVLSASRRKPYDGEIDARQLEEWVKIANHLGGKPLENYSPMYARSALKPSDDLRAKTKDKLVYVSPARPPVFGVDVERLNEVIATHKGKFGGWPDPEVISFDEAETAGLRLVGRNFLQFYFVWMEPEYYRALWKSGLNGLLHPLPGEDDEADYEDIDKNMLVKEKERKGPDVNAATKITSNTSSTRSYVNTQLVMGKSATMVAERLWGTNYITAGMGNSTVEWLHRVTHSLSGKDAFKNLVFGTWECNTDVVCAANFVRKLTEKVDDRIFEGRLKTISEPPGPLSRNDTLLGTNTNATIPKWATKYPWLCFALKYQYEMDEAKSPLGVAIAHEVTFDLWSIFVPLSLEPRLDTYILQALKPGGSTIDAVSRDFTISKVMVNPQPLPNVPLPEYDAGAYPKLAREASINELPSVELPGIVIKNPTVATVAGCDDVPTVEPTTPDDHSRSNRSLPIETPVHKDGFVPQGEINLFGTDVVGNLEKWIGPPPGDIIVGTDPASIERVVVPGDFHMSMLIPLLRGTPFDDIIFRNAVVSHQNYAFDKTKSIGWHINTDWVIDTSCGLLYDILKTVLQVNQLILSIHAAFGKSLHWKVPLDMQSFILEGVFPKLTLSPVSGLTLTSIGVRLLGIQGFTFTPEPHSTLSFGFAVFGTMKLSVPGSVVPLNLDYEMGLIGETVNLHAELSGSNWEDALGVQGLRLNDVVFETSLSVTSPLKTFESDVFATFAYLSSVAYLHGSYAADGQLSLAAELDNFGIKELNDFFYTLFGDFLTLPDYDVHIGSATVSIGSGEGVSISLLDVRIAEYTAVSLKVTLSSSGASLSGDLSSSTVTFGDVELRNAMINLSLWTTNKKKKVDFVLSGTLGVNFLDLKVAAAVHLYPGEGHVDWAVIAELSAQKQHFAISNVVPGVRGTFVDSALDKAVFIVASQDDPLISESFPGYQVRKGVQVLGIIDRIQALNDLLHQDVKGLVLRATWSADSGFSLSVSLPATASINLGKGIKTTPITLNIQTDPIALAITAGVTIPVHDSTPLDFSFMLAADTAEARASGQMEGWWVKPFGIENLKIGPEVTLEVEIVYAQLVCTGTPRLGLSGGLMIGTVEASVAMNISEDPKCQLLYGDVKKLDISDVVEFAGNLLQENIPKIPNKMLQFEELKIHVCPFGVVLGKTSYPQGFSFTADLLVFEKRANIQCTIDKVQKSVDLIGSIDDLALGPLTLRGSKDPRATLECHVGVSKQQLVVDGVVSIFDAEAQTYVNLQFMPDLKFSFHMLLHWANIFVFRLDAKLIGSIHDKLSNADFSLEAELENNLLEYIAQQIVEQFQVAQVAATQGLEAAQKTVQQAKKDWEDVIATANKRVSEAQKTWESYEQDIRSRSERGIEYYHAEITRLEGEIDAARKDYESALNDAESAVRQVNQDRASALASAKRDVEDTRRDMENDVRCAQWDLDDAKADLTRMFGDAQRDVDNAQREVDEIQWEIDSTMETIHEYEDAPWYEFWKKIALGGLWTCVGTLEASRAVAIGVLDVARGILTGTEYVAKEGGVEAAKRVLDLAQLTEEGILSATQGALTAADATSKAAVDAAEATLEGVKQGGKYVAFEAAKEALETFKNGGEEVYKGAVAAIEGLMESGEFIAFNTAKAGLEVAKGSTAILDAANEVLVIAEKASQAALTTLEEIVKFAAKALNIKTITLSGTLCGVLGIDGGKPLTAVIKGYLVGHWFDVKAVFDPRNPVEFITELFKQLWDLVSSGFQPGLLAASVEQQLVVEREVTDVVILPGPSLAASSKFLQERPHVHKMLTDVSDLIHADISCGPFSGRQIVPPVAVATKALIMMHGESGISVFEDLHGM